jgi:hypothetical protein
LWCPSNRRSHSKTGSGRAFLRAGCSIRIVGGTAARWITVRPAGAAVETAEREWIRAGTTAAVFQAPEDAAAGRMTTEGQMIAGAQGEMTGRAVEDEVRAADRFRTGLSDRGPVAIYAGNQEKEGWSVVHSGPCRLWLLNSGTRILGQFSGGRLVRNGSGSDGGCAC